jgi:hypothetical protein
VGAKDKRRSPLKPVRLNEEVGQFSEDKANLGDYTAMLDFSGDI